MKTLRQIGSLAFVLGVVTAIICVLSGCAGQRRFVDLGEGTTRVSVQKNCVTEMRLRSAIGYGDPYNEVTLDVVFDGPNGDSLRVPAFWVGSNVWAVRFAGEPTTLIRVLAPSTI